MAYKLTPLGESRARRIASVRGPDDAAVCFMYEVKDPVEIDEIKDELRSDYDRVLEIVGRLMHSGYVKEV